MLNRRDCMNISERKKRILRAVIEDYIATAEPVGSKAISKHAGLDFSPATIRNEMADLEAMGLLEQPHTSAGRVPSPGGYRFYVNELMERHRLSLQETERLNAALQMKTQELDRVITEATRVISKLTKYPSYAISAGPSHVTIRRFDLLLVESQTFIVVVMTDTNIVKNKLLRIPSDLSETQIHLLNRLLNASFTGLALEEITPELMEAAKQAVGEGYALLAMAVSFATEVMREQETYAVHVSGLARLLEYPEYRNLERAQPLLTYLSEENALSALPKPDDSDIKIYIGPENVAGALQDTSVVVASYDIGENMRGLIGIVGPTRMDYAKIAARLYYFADGLTKLLGEGGQTPGQK